MGFAGLPAGGSLEVRLTLLISTQASTLLQLASTGCPINAARCPSFARPPGV